MSLEKSLMLSNKHKKHKKPNQLLPNSSKQPTLLGHNNAKKTDQLLIKHLELLSSHKSWISSSKEDQKGNPVTALSVEVHDYGTSLADKNSQIDNLRLQIKVQDQVLNDKDIQIAELRAHVKELEQHLRKLTSKCLNSPTNNSKLSDSTTEHLQRTVAEKDQTIINLQKQLKQTEEVSKFLQLCNTCIGHVVFPMMTNMCLTINRET